MYKTFFAVLAWSVLLTIRTYAQGAESPTLENCIQEVEKATGELRQNYTATLAAATKSYQVNGDLDGYVAAQEELKRFETAKTVKPENYVSSPADLAWQQAFQYASHHETILQVTERYIQTLLPEQRRLTQEGKIEDALKIRARIAAIRNQFKDAYEWRSNREKNPKPTVVPASALIGFYTRRQELADKLLKGKVIMVEGIVSDLASDPSNGGIFHVSLQNPDGGQTQVDCSFRLEDYSINRISGGDRVTASFTRRDSDQYEPYVLTKGTKVQISGSVSGRHINVNLTDCRFTDDIWVKKPPTTGSTASGSSTNRNQN